MENLDKKPKRPRFTVSRNADDSDAVRDNRFEKINFGRRDNGDSTPAADNGGEENNGGYTPRSYNQRPQGGYNRYNNGGQQGGYNNRQGGYNNYSNNNGERQGGYNRQPGGYNNRYNNNRQQGGYNRYNNGGQQGGYNNYNRYNNHDYQQPTATDGATTVSTDNNDTTQQEGGYTPRPYNQRPQGGYNNRQGGYNNRQQGGFNNNRQGGYNNNRQGGFNNRYNNGGQQGGYNNRQGGYNNNRQGGYNNRQQGGYNNRYNNQQQAQQRPGKSFTPRPKRVEYEMPLPDPNEQIRLNKFMANAGICSRREADEFIQQGLVKVNGNVVTELGTKVSHSDTVEYSDKIVALESKCYILLNKPKDCVTTSDDPNGRLTVMDLVKGACTERIYPVGRLDRNTTGVLLLTNDGDLASKLTHPKFIKKKIYHVWTDKDISEDDMQRIADGIELEDGPIHADAISYATEKDRNQAGIEIHSGRNRIVRRIFEHLGYHVTKLDRVYFAGLTKKNLPRGRWRYLTQEEVNFLKMGSFE